MNREAAGVAVLTAGAVATGLVLGRQLALRQASTSPAVDDAPLITPHSDGPVVETPDGVRLHVEVDEPDTEPADDAPTLVFVHGYTLSLDCWQFQRRYYRGRYRMIFYDQRSHGRSGRSAPQLCRIPQLAEDLAQILREVAGSGPVILIGHSMGGMTILNLARQHRPWFGGSADGVGPIAGVGLICTSADGWVDPGGLPGRVASRSVEPVTTILGRLPGIVDRTRTAGTRLADLLTREVSYVSPVPASYVRFTDEMFSVTPMAVIGDFLPAFLDLDQTESLAVLDSIPTTVVGARRDRVLPIRHTEAMLEHLPNAERLILEQSGHLAMIEHHDEVDRALDGLLARAR